jgi:hypothetical protein
LRHAAYGLVVLGLLLGHDEPARAAVVKATYLFDNNLNAQEAGAPPLTAVDPLGLNSFGPATVFGRTRTVYNFNGNAFPTTEQGGLLFDNTGGLIANNNYSVEMLFQFTQRDGVWRRILDVENRQADNGFYVSPGNQLDVYPVASGGKVFTNNAFHDVVLTDASDGTVKAYLDGSLSFAVSTNVMNINNPQNLVNFFLDNVGGSYNNEYSNGSVARIALFDGVLTDGQVASLALLPGDADGDGTVNGADLNTVLSNYNLTGMDWAHGDFDDNGTVNGSDLNTVLSNYNQSSGVGAAVPEPSAFFLLGIGAISLLACAWRRWPV